MKKLITTAISALTITGALIIGTGNVSAQVLSTATLTVNDTSSSATSITVSGATQPNNTFCNTPEGSTTLSIVGGHLGTGASWGWYEDACPASTTPAPVHTGTTYDVSIANTGTEPISKTYYVRAEGGTCAPSECTPVTIIIYPTPVITNQFADASYCNGTAVEAVAFTGTPTGANGTPAGEAVHYTYTVTGDNIGISGTDVEASSLPAFTATNNGGTTLTATVTVTPHANGCDGTPVSFTIKVNPAIVVTASTQEGSIPSAVCAGTLIDEINFSSNITDGNIQYSWTNSNPSIGAAASGTNSEIQPFTAANTFCEGSGDGTAGHGDISGHFVITATYTNGGVASTCPVTGDSFDIVVHPTPNGTISVPSELCAGEEAHITFTASCATYGPYNLQIYEGTDPQSGETNGSSYINIPNGGTIDLSLPSTGSHQYNLMKITDANQCSIGE